MLASVLAVQNADPHLSGYLQPLLSSVTVPLTGLFAWKINGTVFTRAMLCGTCVVLAGLCVAVLPSAFDSADSSSSSSNDDGADSGRTWLLRYHVVARFCVRLRTVVLSLLPQRHGMRQGGFYCF